MTETAFGRRGRIGHHASVETTFEGGPARALRKRSTLQRRTGRLTPRSSDSRIRPKQLLLAWVTLAGFTEGPVFRKLTPQGRITAKPMSDRSVALAVKARAEAAG